jgi:hypothetical protein
VVESHYFKECICLIYDKKTANPMFLRVKSRGRESICH